MFNRSLFAPQIVKALEHLHSKLSVIHRGKSHVNFDAKCCCCCFVLTLLCDISHCCPAVVFTCRREALQCSDQHAGPSENVRLRHQRPPGGLGGQDIGCRLQALHGGRLGPSHRHETVITNYSFWTSQVFRRAGKTWLSVESSRGCSGASAQCSGGFSSSLHSSSTSWT